MELRNEFKNRTTRLKIQYIFKIQLKNQMVFGYIQNTPINSSIFALFTGKLWKKE